ncbi:MAG TPA: beta-propeller fold lactonase family protein [Longimicrobiales bacterium]
MSRRIQPARTAAALLLAMGSAACAARPAVVAGPLPPAAAYTAWVANEASDLITRLSYTPGGDLEVVRRIGVGAPGRIAGPHGIAASSDGRFWYVSLSHGTSYGRVRKYSVDGDSLLTAVGVGPFPETVSITPDGQYVFLTNQDLHATAQMSGISVVYTPTMTEVARPNTCPRPQGGRLNATAATHFSVCSRTDQLVSVDARSFAVVHRFSLTPRQEQTVDLDAHAPADANARCEPGWVEPGRGVRAGFVYVACRASDQVIEIDAVQWQVTRRFTFDAPGHMAIDPAGRKLVIAQPADSALILLDLDAATSTTIATSRSGPRGIAITADGLYAFVANEAAGAARGTVDVIDLASGTRVASAEAAYAPAAIDVIGVR